MAASLRSTRPVAKPVLPNRMGGIHYRLSEAILIVKVSGGISFSLFGLPFADAVAVDRGDDWFRIWVVLQQGVVDHPRHFRPGRQIAADIGADGKGSRTRGGRDDAAAIAVALQLVP